MVDRGRHAIVMAHGCRVLDRKGTGVGSMLSWAWWAQRHLDGLTPPALFENPPVGVHRLPHLDQGQYILARGQRHHVHDLLSL